jgi:DNA segregation ATPase FtsK/SpoIIIE, S-DNA-T family
VLVAATLRRSRAVDTNNEPAVDNSGLSTTLADGPRAPTHRLDTQVVRTRLTVVHGSTRFDVLVDATDGATVGDVADELAALFPSEPRPLRLWRGNQQLLSVAQVSGSALTEGAILAVAGTGAPMLPEPVTPPEPVIRLQVVGGPNAGTIVPLRHGDYTVGRAPECEITLADPDVSRRHAVITVTSESVSVRDIGSLNGTLIDGVVVPAAGRRLVPGQLVRVGHSALTIAGVADAEAASAPRPGGVVVVNRAPLSFAVAEGEEIPVPVRESAGSQQRISWLSALLPALASGALALWFRSVQFLAFVVLSPITMLGAGVGERFHARRRRSHESTRFRQQHAHAMMTVAQRLERETALRRRRHPDAAAVVRTATLPDGRLWERGRTHPDRLSVRIGLCDIHSRTRIRQGLEARPAAVLIDVPACYDLTSGPLGLAGPVDVVRALARWIVGQIAVLHSPLEVELVLLLSDQRSDRWRWARWLPHLAEGVAHTPERRYAVVARLAVLVDSRSARPAHPNGWPGPWTVLVIDRWSDLADTPGLSRVLAAGGSVGVAVICIDDNEQRLPTWCTGVVRASGETGTELVLRGRPDAHDHNVRGDRVSCEWAELVARALAPLRDASMETTTALPASVRLLDLIGLPNPTPVAIADRWRLEPDSARTTIGLGPDGPVDLDLVRDGPHALVAGTTGSGKSELLRSMVAGLAATYSPDAMTFVLIDYKGGATFAECAALPHTVGVVTDLDPQSTRRALTSLDAELRRREELFARASVSDLAAYRRSPQERLDPLARLILIVDEFAALADELPDFLRGLVSIAQRGRSLGVHLVLATQRPGGVVSPEIRANTTLRVALRVTDAAESADVIGTPSANLIDKHRPGRAIMRTGSALTEIQTAQIGAAFVGGDDRPRVIPLDGWGLSQLPDTKQMSHTDLQALTTAVCGAAQLAGGATPRPPWLPELPRLLPSARLSQDQTATSVALGIVDLPDQQAQHVVTLDLARAETILLAGGPRSGRTTVATQIAVGAADHLSPDEFHLYVIDCSGGALRSLAVLPHCGAVATRESFSTIARLIDRLRAEVTRRQAHLSDVGARSVAASLADGPAPPYMLLVIDGWEGLVAASQEHDAGRTVDCLASLLREAGSAALSVVLTGDRTTLSSRATSSVGRRFILRFPDPNDYAFAGLPPRAAPDQLPPGRAVTADTGLEVQFAFLGDSPSWPAQCQVVTEVSARYPKPRHRPPLRIRSLPARVRLADVARNTAEGILLGLAGDGAEPAALDLFAADGRLLIAGPSRSGRTTTLRTILKQAVWIGLDVVVACRARSVLAGEAASHGLSPVVPDDPPDRLRQPRRNRLLVIVDDCEAFLDSHVGDALVELARTAPAGLAIVAAGRSDELALTYRGIGFEVRRAGTGVLLHPEAADGELLGVRLPRVRSAELPGRGILVADRRQLVPMAAEHDGYAEPVPIQIALP